MALWNIICRGRIRKMLATSLGISIGLICLLAFIGIPAFSRSSDLIPNLESASDADQNMNDITLTQHRTRLEVTPPEVPPPSPTSCPPTQCVTATSTQTGQRVAGSSQFSSPLPPPPPFPPTFSHPLPIRHITITIHRLPEQDSIIPPTPPAGLTPPPAPPLMPPPSVMPPVTPTATVVATATALSTPQATATGVPLELTPEATATSVPASPTSAPSPSISVDPHSSSDMPTIR